MVFLLRPLAWWQFGVKTLQNCMWPSTWKPNWSWASCVGSSRVGSELRRQVGTDCTSFGTGKIVLRTCLILPIDFLGTLHVSLDQPPCFWMGQKEGEDSLSTTALNVFLAHLTCTDRRRCAFCLPATNAVAHRFSSQGHVQGCAYSCTQTYVS